MRTLLFSVCIQLGSFPLETQHEVKTLFNVKTPPLLYVTMTMAPKDNSRVKLARSDRQKTRQRF